MSGRRIYPEDTFNNQFLALTIKVFGATLDELVSVTPMVVDTPEIKRQILSHQIGEQIQMILRKHCQ